MNSKLFWIAPVAGFLLACSCSTHPAKTTEQYPAHDQNYHSAQYTGKLEPDDGQWIRPAKDLASTRYSTLDEINTSNVKNLSVAFTFSLGTNRGAEAAPIVANNTMFIVTPFPNIVYALDLTKPGAPVKWSFDPHPSPASQGVAC